MRLGEAAFAVVLAFGVIAAAGPAAAERRVALVIGNSDYTALPTLPNPAHDADAVTEILREADFEVVEGRNLKRIDLEHTLRTFIRSLNRADVALFYFSGHGISVAGNNYVVPVDAELKDVYDLEFETMPLEEIVSYMKSNSKVQLVFLDACRNSPFDAGSFMIGEDVVPASRERGLTRVRLGLGTLVAYAAAPGEVALDGAGHLSPFTDAFSRRALTPATEVRRVLDMVRKDVVEETDGKQIPWENSSLLTDFYFVPPKQRPLVEDLHQVQVAAGAPARGLGIAMPRQPEGGALKVVVEKVPDIGTVTSDDKPVAAGAEMTPEALAGLTYAAPAGASGAGLVVYRVRDDWGNDVQAMAAITIAAAAAPAATPAPEPAAQADEQVVAALEPVTGTTTSIDLGVGPRPLLADAAAIEAAGSSAGWLAVRQVPANGVLRDGGRPLRPGDTFAASALAGLTFEPQIGSENQPLKVALGPASAPSGGPEIDINVQPAIHPCDLLAGQRFDLQGVTQGLFANELDPDKAGPACLDAVAHYPNVPRFFYALGRVELARGHPDKAIGLIRAAAERGHIRAVAQLGVMTRLGAGTVRDETAAVKLLEEAVAKGDPFAMQSLAKMLWDGIGVAQDRKRGLALYLQAAEIGHTFSMNSLGALFMNGEGVKQDTKRALQYYEASAARGDIYGYRNLGTYYLEGPEEARDYDKALQFFTLAYAGGHPFAANDIGRMYYNGWGVPKDVAQAVHWYELGARRGDAYAANNRAFIALNGPQEYRDPSFAAEMYAAAITLNQGKPSQQAAEALGAMDPREKRRAIQHMLTQAGFDSGPMDGIVGPITLSAATAFADSVGTTVDGVDDRRLILALARAKWLSEAPRFDLF